VAEGHHVVLIARGVQRRDDSVLRLPRVTFAPIGTRDTGQLTEAFAGCDGVAHCAGINREIGKQTYRRVHVEGTQSVVHAARRAGVPKIALLSFLRARPNCGSGYHESKSAAEEIVRGSGLDYTILKCGVIYGRGDHMLDHLSHALHTFPIFGLVGLHERPVRPTAVEDVVRVLRAALIEGRLSRRTVAVVGPEEMPLGEAVRHVARVIERHPFFIRLPTWMHYGFAWCFERLMTVPLVSLAQVRILSEGIVEPLPFAENLPADLTPRIRFTDEQIRRGLPEPARFGVSDCRCWHALGSTDR
jgi:NADH dehydrogenase